jgi:hypothetical protein
LTFKSRWILIYFQKNVTVYYFVVTAYDLEGNESDYSNEVCVAGGIACATDTGTDTGSAKDSGGGGSSCLISAAADGSRLAAEMAAFLLLLGFFFISIEILRKRIQKANNA